MQSYLQVVLALAISASAMLVQVLPAGRPAEPKPVPAMVEAPKPRPCKCIQPKPQRPNVSLALPGVDSEL